MPKAASRYTPPKEPAPPFEMIKIDSTAIEEVERIAIFQIDETVYSIPVKIRPNVAMAVLNAAATEGMEVALGQALRRVLGGDAMDALSECEAMTDLQLQYILTTVNERLMGAVSDTVGKSFNGSGRSHG